MTEFYATGFGVAKSHDKKRTKLSFESDADGLVEVVVETDFLTMILAQIRKEIESTVVTPIDRGSLKPGQSLQTRGFHVDQLPNGGAVLVIHADLLDEGRVVTIPLELSREAAKDLKRMLE